MAKTARADAAASNVTDETILKSFREFEDARGTFETAKARYRNVRKKIESYGVDLKELEHVIELKRRDPDEVLGTQKTFLRYCRVLSVPLGTQFTLLDAAEDPDGPDISEKAREEQEAWEAGQQGFNSGRNGEPAGNNQHPPGSLNFNAWSEGHRRGDKQRQEGLVMKRGRPKKNKDPEAEAEAA